VARGWLAAMLLSFVPIAGPLQQSAFSMPRGMIPATYSMGPQLLAVSPQQSAFSMPRGMIFPSTYSMRPPLAVAHHSSLITHHPLLVTITRPYSTT
jgi:hypothetical protein